jgi:hypothetical protein
LRAAGDDLPHGIADRSQNDSELGIVLANNVEMAKSLEEALPHLGADLIGLQDHIEKRPPFHRERSAPRS